MSGARPIKDDGNQSHEVPDAWRPTIHMLVKAFASGDLKLENSIPDVEAPSDSTVEQVSLYLRDYGETLVDLPSLSWESSECQWTGSHWSVMVDLWTAESGWSDLVLGVRVFEREAGFRFVVDMVYVP